MASQTVSGGQTYNGAHDVRRELPYITGFPSLQGVVSSIVVSGYFRTSSSGTVSVLPGIWKTFTYPSASDHHWVDETTRYRQNQSNSNYYMDQSNWSTYLTNLLTTSGAISFSKNGTTQSFSFTLMPTDWGKNLSNWGGGKLIIGMLVPEGTSGLNWGNNTNCTITVNYNAGSIVYYYNGSTWVPTNPYYYNGSEWKACQVSRYNGSSWTQC